MFCSVRQPAAIFDCGGVLTTSVARCFLEFEQALGLPPHSLLQMWRELAEDGSQPAFYELERGRLSEAEFWRRLPWDLEKRLGVRVNLPSDIHEVRQMLWSGLGRNERMLAAARAITTTYKTALLTNGVREWAHLRALCCPEMFDIVVDSCEVRVRKPELEIYEVVCTRLGIEPEDAVFIDDIPVNVDAARSVGMTGILFQGTQDAIRQLEEHFPAAFAGQDSTSGSGGAASDHRQD